MGSETEGKLHIGWAREDGTFDVLVQTLARRVVIEGASWDIGPSLEHMWVWAGPGGEARFKLGSELNLRVRGGRPIRLHGKIQGRRLLPEARMYRRVLLAFELATPQPSLVILARDGDGRSAERRRGFEQVVGGLEWPFSVILAMPEPESEAWFVCGFEPRSKHETVLHVELKLELGFDPVRAPQRLTAQPNDAKTDAKRVAKRLLGDDSERRRACLETPLEVLSSNGAEAGLARLLDELRSELLPRIDPGSGVARS